MVCVAVLWWTFDFQSSGFIPTWWQLWQTPAPTMPMIRHKRGTEWRGKWRSECVNNGAVSQGNIEEVQWITSLNCKSTFITLKTTLLFQKTSPCHHKHYAVFILLPRLWLIIQKYITDKGTGARITTSAWFSMTITENTETGLPLLTCWFLLDEASLTSVGLWLMSKHKVLRFPVGGVPLCVSNCFPIRCFFPIVNLCRVHPIIAPFSNRIGDFQSQVAVLWLN